VFVKLSRTFAKRFCETLATSDQAIFAILKAHPEFPQWRQLLRWRDKHAWFAAMWRRAREEQGEHLAQKCLNIARTATPKNAHQCRVQFDIYKWVASRFAPAIYGDKPTAPQTNIAVGVTISTERLNEIRSKLDVTRAVMVKGNSNGNAKSNAKPPTNGDSPKVERQPLMLPTRT
jgi:hypothetical protein